jgi:hypothetical protein
VGAHVFGRDGTFVPFHVEGVDGFGAGCEPFGGPCAGEAEGTDDAVAGDGLGESGGILRRGEVPWRERGGFAALVPPFGQACACEDEGEAEGGAGGGGGGGGRGGGGGLMKEGGEKRRACGRR